MKTLQRIAEMTFVLALVWLTLQVSGCSTISGIGEDLQRLSSPYNNR